MDGRLAHLDAQLMRTQLQLFERSHGFMMVFDGPELRYSFANPTALRLMGETNVGGKLLLDVLPDFDPALSRRAAFPA